MQKGDEVDEVVVVEIKLVWKNKFQTSLTKSPLRNDKEIHYVDILLTTQTVVAGTSYFCFSR